MREKKDTGNERKIEREYSGEWGGVEKNKVEC